MRTWIRGISRILAGFVVVVFATIATAFASAGISIPSITMPSDNASQVSSGVTAILNAIPAPVLHMAQAFGIVAVLAVGVAKIIGAMHKQQHKDVRKHLLWMLVLVVVCLIPFTILGWIFTLLAAL